MLSLFISHSSRDDELVATLVALLSKALHLRSEQIRCTSLDGYRLPGGTEFTNRLKKELLEARTFVAVISPASLDSIFVLFELGARWGADKKLIPLVVPAVGKAELPQPLGSLNLLRCDSRDQLHQLVGELAKDLNVKEEGAEVYSKDIDVVLRTLGNDMTHPSRVQQSEPLVSGTWVGWIHTMKGKYYLAIEWYHKDATGISVVGCSYNRQLRQKADWYSTSASFNPIDGCMYITYRTTVDKSAGQTIETRGSGRLRVQANEITGTVFDRPEKVFREGKELWEPKFFEYRFIQVAEEEKLLLDTVCKTDEFRRVMNELSGLSDEWVAT
jgi:hypothetical protein